MIPNTIFDISDMEELTKYEPDWNLVKLSDVKMYLATNPDESHLEYLRSELDLQMTSIYNAICDCEALNCTDDIIGKKWILEMELDELTSYRDAIWEHLDEILNRENGWNPSVGIITKACRK